MKQKILTISLLCCCGAGRLSLAADPYNWTARSSNTTANLTRVKNGVWNGGSWFLACGEGGTLVFSNDDGQTWTPLSTGDLTYADLAFGNGVVIAVGSNGVIDRLNGGNIERTQFDPGIRWLGVAYGRVVNTNGWVAVGAWFVAPSSWYEVTLYSLNDGGSWQVCNVIPRSSFLSCYFNVDYCGNHWIYPRGTGNVDAGLDFCGIVCTASPSFGALQEAASDGFTSVVVGGDANGGVIYCTTDSCHWTAAGPSNAPGFFSVARGSGWFVATTTGGRIYASNTGCGGWARITSPTAADLQGVAASATSWIACGTGGTIIRSGGKADLAQYTPPGWDGPIVVSTSQNDTQSRPLTTDDVGYVSGVFASFGPGDAPSFPVRIDLDGSPIWITSDVTLLANYYQVAANISVGPLAAGNHVVTVTLDGTNVVVETNESNNVFSKTFQVTAVCDPCDTNCDGSVNQFDIEPFVAAIAAHAGCSPCAADTNNDGSVNQFDIQLFVTCLGG